MRAILPQFVRTGCVVAGTVLALAGVESRGAESTLPADAFPVFDSYIKVTGQAASITGDSAAYAKRFQRPTDGSYGIEDLHFSRDLGKAASMDIDGRALSGAEDYLAKLHVNKDELGSFEVGYQRFRTFYDGVGGFFPLNKAWMPLANEELHLDRGKFWVEGTLARPNAPVLTVRYVNELRSGQKDSTIWGDTDFTGLPNNNPPISQVRKIVPSYLDLDERHQSLEATLKHTVGNTTLQLTVLGDKVDNLDTRYMKRFPGEAKPFPSPAATVLLPAAQMNNQILMQQSDGVTSKTSAVTGLADTVINEKLTLHFGGSFQLVHSDFTGERPIVTSTPTATGVVPVATAQVQGLTGSARVKVYTGNFSFDYKAAPDLSLKLGVRAEDEYIRGNSAYNVLAASGNPAVKVTSTPRVDWSRIQQHSATPVLDARYTGISNLSLYFDGSLRNLGGTEKNTSSYNPLTATNGTLANNNISEDNGDFTLGANWRQSQFLTLRAEGFRKHREYQSTGFSYNLGDYYLLDSDYTGVKLTAITHLMPTVTSTTRYIYQTGTMQVTGFLPTYPAYDSCDSKNHTISETIDWNPNTQCYVQVNANVVFNVIGTIYPRAGITPASGTSISFDSNLVLQNANNNYVTASVLSGWVLEKNTDVQVQYTYYRANDGNAQLAVLSQPYGAAAEESIFTIGIKHKFNDRLVVNAKVGYVDSTNATTGGFTDYRGPLGYVSIDYKL